MTARTSSTVSVCAPDSTGSAPRYSANAVCMMRRTSGASSRVARRTLTVTRPESGLDAVREDLAEQFVGDGEGAFARLDPFRLRPGLDRHARPGRPSREPQQRFDL